MFYQNQKEENTMFQTFQKTILQLTLFLIVTAMIFVAGLPAAMDLNVLEKMDAVFGGLLLIFG